MLFFFFKQKTAYEIGTNRELVAAALAARAASSSRSIKISASMAYLPGSPLFDVGDALPVQNRMLRPRCAPELRLAFRAGGYLRIGSTSGPARRSHGGAI